MHALSLHFVQAACFSASVPFTAAASTHGEN